MLVGDREAALTLAFGIQDDSADLKIKTAAMVVGHSSYRRKRKSRKRRELASKSKIKGFKRTESQSKSGQEKGRATSRILFTLLVVIFVVVYPFIMMPIFSSTSISDSVRVLICCIIHPALSEMAMMFLRARVFETAVKDVSLLFTHNLFDFLLKSY